MASFLNKTSLFSHLRTNPQRESLFAQPSRGCHIELGEREKALLAKDPALSGFQSHKKSLKRIKSIGSVLEIVVVAGFCYGIYARMTMREEARK